MILLRGISGFWDAKTKPPPLEVRKHSDRCVTCWPETTEGLWQKWMQTPPQGVSILPRSTKYESSIFVLQNDHYLYAAFAQRDPFGGFTLTQQPKWLQLPESPVHVLSLDELNQDWHSLCKELGQEDLEQINFWRPQTVGEIIFNTWD